MNKKEAIGLSIHLDRLSSNGIRWMSVTAGITVEG